MTNYNDILKAYGHDIGQLIDMHEVYMAEQPDILDFDISDYRELYSDSFLNDLINELKIQNNEHRMQMAYHILIAAHAYKSAHSFNKHKLRQSDFINHIKKMKTGFNKAYTELHTLTEVEEEKLWYVIQFFAAFEKKFIDSSNPFAQILMSHSLTKFHHLTDFFQMLIEVSDDQIEKPNIHTADFESPVREWITEIAIGWLNYSNVPFMTGQYVSKDSGYLSEAMDILMKIISPIDSDVENKEVGNALRAFKKENA